MVAGATADCVGPAAGPTAPLLSPPPAYGIPFPEPPAYVLLTVYPHRRRRRRRCSPCRCFDGILSSSSLLALAFFLISLTLAAFFLWPSDPEIKIARIRLDRVQVSTLPIGRIDISIGLELAIRNPDFFSLDYSSLDVGIWYRGRRLGSVASGGGRIRARGVSYVEAQLQLDGIRVLDDVLYLIEDLASGSIPFDTFSKIKGHLHLFFFDVPIEGKFSCAVHVNAQNQTIVQQDCCPE